MDNRLLVTLLTAAGLLATGLPTPAQARPARGDALLVSTHSATYAMDPRTGRIIRQIADGSDGVVSPQRRRVAFARDLDACFPDPPDGGCSASKDLLTARLDGSAERVIVRNREERSSMRGPDWSPDGRRIAFHWGTPGERALAIVNADGTGLRPLVPGAPDGTFSPDGTRIAYSQNDNIHVVDVATGATRAVTTDGSANGTVPDWSPDGEHILYAGNTEFFTVPAEGGPSIGSGQWPRQVYMISALVVSPDGRRVAFAATDESAPDGTAVSRVYLANRDGSGLTALAEGHYELTDWIGL
ncbi:MAG TPA: DPP IV N-terminal domain-containing protein [Catenuloplanes sp.]|jgi:Tol biopolymer transport system component